MYFNSNIYSPELSHNKLEEYEKSRRDKKNSSKSKFLEKIIISSPKNNDEFNEFIEKNKINDERLVIEILRKYQYYYDKIAQHVRKFSAYIRSKNIDHLTKDEYYDKIMKYAIENKLSDVEFDMFNKMISTGIHEKDVKNITYKYTSPMAKTLGITNQFSSGLNITNSKDKEYCNQIEKIYHDTNQLYIDVCVQSARYNEINNYIVNSKYDMKTDGKYYIDPIIAALFLPKIPYIEFKMIYANIAELVTKIYRNKSINGPHLIETLNDLINDPNQNSLSTNMTPIHDLYNKVQIQKKLWECVLNLRNGKFYSSTDFKINSLLKDYPDNIFDSPDLLFTFDAGNTLRKLFNAMSIRPITIKRTKINNPKSTNTASTDVFKVVQDKGSTYLIKQKDYNPEIPDTDNIKSSIVHQAMINVILPNENNSDINFDEVTPINLNGSIPQIRWFKDEHEKTAQLYNTSIIGANGIFIYYINRISNKTTSIKKNEETEEFNIMGYLPINTYKCINISPYPIVFEETIFVAGFDTPYKLKSIICYNTDRDNISNTNKVTSMFTIINVPATDEITASKGINTHICYNPHEAMMSKTNDPPIVQYIDEINKDETQNIETYQSVCKSRGSVFIYINENWVFDVSAVKTKFNLKF